MPRWNSIANTLPLLEKTCGRCEKIKPSGSFGPDKRTPDQLRWDCLECRKNEKFKTDERTEKFCPKCKTTKPMDSFGKLGHRFQPYCKTCRQEDGKKRYYDLKVTGEFQAKNREDYIKRRKWLKLRKVYGISQEQYWAMVEAQGNKCAICKKPETEIYRGKVLALSVDHDHKTGKVRGLLYRKCNIAIGRFREDLTVIQNALDYLRSYSEER
jgi:hypothetical protein